MARPTRVSGFARAVVDQLEAVREVLRAISRSPFDMDGGLGIGGHRPGPPGGPASEPAYTWREGQQIGGFRTMLGVPVRKEARLIGVINVARMEVRPFSADEIELAQTFADQAAIVIDNVRLLGPT